MTDKQFNEIKERVCSEVRTSGELNYGYPSMTTFKYSPRKTGKLIAECKKLIDLYEERENYINNLSEARYHLEKTDFFLFKEYVVDRIQELEKIIRIKSKTIQFMYGLYPDPVYFEGKTSIQLYKIKTCKWEIFMEVKAND